MLSQGISLLLVDNEEVIEKLLPLLHVDKVVPLSNMVDYLDTLYDEVFVEVFKDSEERAEKYLHTYNVRRAIIVNNGRSTCYGRDLTWLKITLSNHKELSLHPTPATPKINFRTGEITGVVVEKDDPYAEIGYRR